VFNNVKKKKKACCVRSYVVFPEKLSLALQEEDQASESVGRESLEGIEISFPCNDTLQRAR